MSTPFMAPVDQIRNNPANPRKVLRNIDELAMSIREHGLIQAIVVTEDPDRAEGHFLLHAGHRRLAAYRKLGIKTIPAVLRNIPTSRNTEVMLVENLQRDDLTPIEIGKALAELRDSHDPPLRQADLARRLGKSVGWVGQMLLFSELDDTASEEMAAGELTWGEATEQAREAKRERGGRVHTMSERVEDRPSRGWYLSWHHPLALDAKLICDVHGHSRTSGRRIGNVACGSCWEIAIRADERGGHDEISKILAGIEPDIDRVVVETLANLREANVSGNPAERLEAFGVMLAAGVDETRALVRLGLNETRDRERMLRGWRRLVEAREHHDTAVAS